MSHYAIYSESGRILRALRLSPSDVEANIGADDLYMQFDTFPDSTRYYILNGELVDKLDMLGVTVSQSGDVVTVSGLADDTIVIWPDGESTTESGSFSFTCNVSGDLRFYLDAPKYFSQWVIVHVA